MMRRIKQIISDLPRALLYGAYWLIYGLSFLYPRDKQLWIFDEWDGHRCADNARYLYFYTHAQPGYCAVWLTHSDAIVNELRQLGMRAYRAYSLPGLWYTLRAGVIIVESHISGFFWLTGGILKINLWHGLPIKKIVYDSAQTKGHNWVYTSVGIRRLYHIYFQPFKVALGDYVLSQSPAWKNFFSSAFRLPPERVLVENQPRNIALLKSDIPFLASERPLMEHLAELHKTKKIVTYLPTFRDGSNNPLAESGLDFAALDSFLGGKGLHLIIKMHHEHQPEGVSYANIEFVPVEFAAMLILRHTDILLTDYSSVFMEFLVANRPIVFFPFDLDTYVGTKREMYFNYNDITPGPKARTVEELYAALAELAAGHDTYQEARNEVRTMILNPHPEHAPAQVFTAIEKILKR